MGLHIPRIARRAERDVGAPATECVFDRVGLAHHHGACGAQTLDHLGVLGRRGGAVAGEGSAAGRQPGRGPVGCRGGGDGQVNEV